VSRASCIAGLLTLLRSSSQFPKVYTRAFRSFSYSLVLRLLRSTRHLLLSSNDDRHRSYLDKKRSLSIPEMELLSSPTVLAGNRRSTEKGNLRTITFVRRNQAFLHLQRRISRQLTLVGQDHDPLRHACGEGLYCSLRAPILGMDPADPFPSVVTLITPPVFQMAFRFSQSLYGFSRSEHGVCTFCDRPLGLGERECRNGFL
jgi:hypothetical protein